MACQGLYVFTHEHALGNAPAQRLFQRVRVQQRPSERPPRAFEDYEVNVVEDDPPAGVTLTRLVG
jgi:CRISPR-associated protein Csd2